MGKIFPVMYTKKKKEGKLEWPVREVIPMLVGFPGIRRSGEASDIVMYWEFGSRDSNVEGSVRKLLQRDRIGFTLNI